MSRSGKTEPGGKLTRRIDVPVTDDLDDGMTALAAVAGIPKAEFARWIMERAVFGELTLLRRVAQQVGRCPWDESRTGRSEP